MKLYEYEGVKYVLLDRKRVVKAALLEKAPK
jgi:hypothetical protein